jgi:hypothetical protein
MAFLNGIPIQLERVGGTEAGEAQAPPIQATPA